MRVEARAPGRVNLIGDHTDHTGGLVLPLAIDRGTTVAGWRGGDRVELRSHVAGETAVLPLDLADPGAVEPSWARYVAGLVVELRPSTGFAGEIFTDLPVGAGLSSSASLLVALALALGADGQPVELAELCQRAEQRAVGVPCGIMDPLTCLAGREGHALLIDTATRTVNPVPVPAAAELVVIDSRVPRALAGSPYAERRARCEAADAAFGPLRLAGSEALAAIEAAASVPRRVRAAGRHVISENHRVRRAATALARGDLAAVGALMAESHASLRDELEVSTPELDELVDRLLETPGVHGARLTGAGFGGCVVALCEPAALSEGWPVRASAGARSRQL